MNIEIKRASIDQIDKIMDWRMEVLSEVFQEWDKENEKELYHANLEYYNDTLTKGQHIAVFAEKDDETAGCGGVCIYREMPSPDNPNGICAYLMNIYTRKQYRGHSIATKIVSCLIDYAKEMGANKIFLEASESGRMVYKYLGFVDMTGYMELPKEV